MGQFVNKSGLEFSDISSEEFREYTWGDMFKLTINRPLRLNVSASGGHRIFTEDGNSFYVPSGWKCLMWKAKEGEPNFVK